MRKRRRKFFFNIKFCGRPVIDFNFRIHFRVSREIFQYLLNVIGPVYYKGVGRKPFPLEKALLIFLKFLATQETLKSLATQFETTESVVHQIVRKIANCVAPAISDTVIVWPTGGRARDIAADFAAVYHWLPQELLGLIDCLEVPICRPVGARPQLLFESKKILFC